MSSLVALATALIVAELSISVVDVARADAVVVDVAVKGVVLPAVVEETPTRRSRRVCRRRSSACGS
jgi:hypothetical protein